MSRCHAPRERVSWNCRSDNHQNGEQSHAPRERVSWNYKRKKRPAPGGVTLHVSVWVEIHNINVHIH